MNLKLLSNEVYEYDPLWQAQLAVLAALVLQLLLPDTFLGDTRHVLVGVEALLLVGLIITTPKLPIFHSLARRVNAVALIAIVTFVNIFTLYRLAHFLLQEGLITNGHQLLFSAVNIFLTNIIIFALWYWEIDGGGPGRRRATESHQRDFLFQQMAHRHTAKANWTPTFIDYLYVSLTNAMAFSPADTMPLSERAKLLMAGQALVSLITIALVAARAISILH